MGPLQFKMSIYGPGGETPYFKRPNSVAFDQEGKIYVTDTGNNRVCVFNKEGRFLFSFGKLGSAKPPPGMKITWKPGEFNYPYGIGVSKDGKIYVADTLNWRVQVFSPSGKPLFWFPKFEDGEKAEVYPTEILVSKDQVYVCDNSLDRIAVFDLRGNYLFSLGEKGREKGKLNAPNGIGLSKKGILYVSDKFNMTLNAFELSGKVAWVLGDVPKSMAESKRFFGLPAGVAVNKDGYIFVVDAFNFTIKIFNPQAKLVSEVGSRGIEAGQFNFARGIRVFQNILAVVDMENNRLQIFKINRKKLLSLKP